MGFFTGPMANAPSLPPPNPTVMTTSLPTTRPLPPSPSTPRSMVSFPPSMPLDSMILLLRAGSHCRPTRRAFTTCPEVILRTLCCCQSRRPPLTLLTVSPVNSMSLTRLVVNPLSRPSCGTCQLAMIFHLHLEVTAPTRFPVLLGWRLYQGPQMWYRPLVRLSLYWPREQSHLNGHPRTQYVVPRSVSETDGNYCVPSSTGGNKALRSNTIGTMDSSRLRKGRRISIIPITCAISPSLWKQMFSNNTSSKSLEV